MPVQFPEMITPGEVKKKTKGEEGIKINQELSFRLVGLRHLLDFWVDKSWRQWAVEASAWREGQSCRCNQRGLIITWLLASWKRSCSSYRPLVGCNKPGQTGISTQDYNLLWGWKHPAQAALCGPGKSVSQPQFWTSFLGAYWAEFSQDDPQHAWSLEGNTKAGGPKGEVGLRSRERKFIRHAAGLWEKDFCPPLPLQYSFFISPLIIEAHPGASPWNCSQGPECDNNERVSKISLPHSGFPNGQLTSQLYHFQKYSSLIW